MPDVKKLSVSMTDDEKAIVLGESKKRGLFNFSAALRLIIREWKANQDERVRITDEGRKALEKNGNGEK